MSDRSNTVRKWRRWHELSQQALADHVGVSRQTIANIERGNYSPFRLLSARHLPAA